MNKKSVIILMLSLTALVIAFFFLPKNNLWDLFIATIGEQYQKPKQERAFSVSEKLDARDRKKTEINKLFSSSADVIELNKKVASISVSGSFKINSPVSFARVIAETVKGEELLVFGSDNYFFLDTGNFDFSEMCDETCFIEKVEVKKIKVELYDAEASITGLNFFESSKLKPTLVEELKSQEASLKTERKSAKLKRLEASIKEKKLRWTVGDTSVFSMSFWQKKQLFGGFLPNLQGFEAYKSGIFKHIKKTEETDLSTATAPGAEGTAATGDSPAPAFDWRNKHGENWLTPVKSQSLCWAGDHFDYTITNSDLCQSLGYTWIGCGSCWAFSVVGATEGIINLYSNQHLDFDLAEEYLVSTCCTSCGDCGGGITPIALDYLKSSGVPDEECFPYNAQNQPCSNRCVDWSNRIWKISGKTQVLPTIYNVKKAINENGLLVMVDNEFTDPFDPERHGSHAIIAVGYGNDAETGDFYVIFKNSWSADWGESGYYMMVIAENDLLDGRFKFYIVDIPPRPPSGISISVACVDKDNDNFCNWGIGPKPGSCPANCVEFVDFDDSNPSIQRKENCELRGDEDKDGLADCADVDDCPLNSYCDANHWSQCNSEGKCVRLPIIRQWAKTAGGNNDDKGLDVAIAEENSIFVVGNTKSFGDVYSDLWLLKYDSKGNQLWNKRAGIKAKYDYGNGVTVAPDGSIVVTGYTTSYGAGNYDLWLLKYDSGGNQLWNKTAGYSGDDRGMDVAVALDGSIYVVGYTNSIGAGNNDLWLLKFDSQGNQLWNKTVGGGSSDYGYGITIAADNSVYVIGKTSSYKEKRGLLLLKYDSNGNQIWERMPGGETGYGVTVDSKGNIYATGMASTGLGDLWLLKYNSDGDLLWDKKVGGGSSDYGYSVAATYNSVYVVGTNSSSVLGSELWLLKFDSEGNRLWSDLGMGFNTDYGYGVAVSSKGSIFSVGYTNSYGSGSYDVWLLKYKERPFCGDALCEAGETFENCPGGEGGDCPNPALCGDGFCDVTINENESNCPVDCLKCNYNGVCNNFETPETCPGDCYDPSLKWASGTTIENDKIYNLGSKLYLQANVDHGSPSREWKGDQEQYWIDVEYGECEDYWGLWSGPMCPYPCSGGKKECDCARREWMVGEGYYEGCYTEGQHSINCFGCWGDECLVAEAWCGSRVFFVDNTDPTGDFEAPPTPESETVTNETTGTIKISGVDYTKIIAKLYVNDNYYTDMSCTDPTGYSVDKTINPSVNHGFCYTSAIGGSSSCEYNCTYNYDWSDGTYEYYVTVTDEAGNDKTTETRTITIF